MNLDQFAKMRGLQSAHVSANTQFLDHLLAGPQGDELREKVLTKRIQFDTNPVLFEMLENTCSLLDCSKREFLEMAVSDAIHAANERFLDSFKEATGHDFGEQVSEVQE